MPLGKFKKYSNIGSRILPSDTDSPQPEHSKLKRFSGSDDIVGYSPDEILKSIERHNANFIIWVRQEEFRVLSDVVMPFIKNRWTGRNIVVCDFGYLSELDQSDIPLILIDASKSNQNNFRVPSGGGIYKYLANAKNPMVMYVYNTGGSRSHLVEVIRLWGEGFLLSNDFLGTFIRGSQSTHIFVSGVWGQEGVGNCINLFRQTGYFSVAGIDW